MSKPNLKSQAKRKRELAKLDKRQAKDQKRALKKAALSEPAVTLVAPVRTPTPAAVAPKALPGLRPAVAPPVAPRKPLTLAEASLLWKTSKVVKAKTRY